jgi:iron-sulfur cluster assembly protein
MVNEKIELSRIEMSINQFPLIMSEKAQSMALRAIKSNDERNLFLRISIKGGGCAGLQYNLDIDDKPSKFDVICHYGDLEVAVDIFSLHYFSRYHC